MALLDQLFRLRGAPRAGKPPVTLGALLVALPPVSTEQPTKPDASEAPADVAANQPSACVAAVPDAPVPEDARISEESALKENEPLRLQLPKFEESARGPIRSGTRFNPFATRADAPAAPAEENATAPQGLGPCLEDPSLPPLRLQAQAPAMRADGPVILGGAAAAGGDASSGELRQIDAPAVRLAPVKLPLRASETPAARPDRPLMLRLEIQAEPSLDVVAFKQHAARFPGVVKCVISDAHD